MGFPPVIYIHPSSNWNRLCAVPMADTVVTGKVNCTAVVSFRSANVRDLYVNRKVSENQAFKRKLGVFLTINVNSNKTNIYKAP